MLFFNFLHHFLDDPPLFESEKVELTIEFFEMAEFAEFGILN